SGLPQGLAGLGVAKAGLERAVVQGVKLGARRPTAGLIMVFRKSIRHAVMLRRLHRPRPSSRKRGSATEQSCSSAICKLENGRITSSLIPVALPLGQEGLATRPSLDRPPVLYGMIDTAIGG